MDDLVERAGSNYLSELLFGLLIHRDKSLVVFFYAIRLAVAMTKLPVIHVEPLGIIAYKKDIVEGHMPNGYEAVW